jgi:ribosomal protein S18 acetylase RimI-like enzyme
MFVDGAVRRQGAGVALVEGVMNWARSRGASRLVLWVAGENNAAVALYRRCGFQFTGGTRPNAHTATLAELEMVRKLE